MYILKKSCTFAAQKDIMISIIVPIFNAEYYLKACVESLLAQTYPDIEVALVDDSSTDGSLAIARAFEEQDKRVVVLQQPHAGQSVARNLGMKNTHGEFIAFVDADDRLEPDWCERHLEAIHGVDYVQSGYKRVADTRDYRIKGYLPGHKYQFTSPCMRLYRREIIARLQFAPGFIYEDILFSADLWLSNARCRRIDYAGYLYTLNPTSTTSMPHPEARKAVLRSLREKTKGASTKGKLILWFTIIRLQCHFLLQ